MQLALGVTVAVDRPAHDVRLGRAPVAALVIAQERQGDLVRVGLAEVGKEGTDIARGR